MYSVVVPNNNNDNNEIEKNSNNNNTLFSVYASEYVRFHYDNNTKLCVPKCNCTYIRVCNVLLGEIFNIGLIFSHVCWPSGSRHAKRETASEYADQTNPSDSEDGRYVYYCADELQYVICTL